ncbi:protein GL2-INTERACTING REPRESSOR 1-like [Curcuma longa]|uniref:protein GL2-INTERACTING REPRESSOR 1-like n=1 Tax=Curcuma longa TaxID=136217 RepID=UPI003D9E5460
MKHRFRRSQRVDLDLKLALPARQDTSRIATDDYEPPPEQLSSPSSCLSLETEHGSPKEAAPMVLAACPRCLMYVMLCGAGSKCPRCKSDVLVDFLHSQGQHQ